MSIPLVSAVLSFLKKYKNPPKVLWILIPLEWKCNQTSQLLQLQTLWSTYCSLSCVCTMSSTVGLMTEISECYTMQVIIKCTRKIVWQC